MQALPAFIRLGLLAGFALASPAAHAQGNPSADQIINSLRPGAGMTGGTRGIRPVGPAPAMPAAITQAPAAPMAREGAPQHAATGVAHASTAHPGAAVTQSGGAPSVNLTVEFASNSAVLTPAAVRTLSELGRALSSSTLAAYRFRIEGHTDTVGSPDANKALSERRAQTVAGFLSDRFHIDGSRLEPAGMGEDGLLVQTPPQTPDPRNRRVQIVNLGA